MGEAEKDGFIALPGKGGHSRLPPTRKLCIPTWEDLMKSFMGFPGGLNDLKKLSPMQKTWFSPWVGKIPWRRAGQPTPVFLPGDSPWTEEPGGLQSTEVTKSRK